MWANWIASRPESVQKLAKDFPLGTRAGMEGKTFYLIGYTEEDMLIFSEINPREDFDGAQENKVYVCAEHFRECEREMCPND